MNSTNETGLPMYAAQLIKTAQDILGDPTRIDRYLTRGPSGVYFTTHDTSPGVWQVRAPDWSAEDEVSEEEAAAWLLGAEAALHGLLQHYHAVRVDEENAAVEWWDSLRERYPRIARALERYDCAVVSSAVWTALSALPGFAGGPDYAPTALIDCGCEGEPWSDVVSSPHKLFEDAE